MENASDSPSTVAKIMKHDKENVQHFKVIVIIFCDRIFVKKGIFEVVKTGF